MMTGTDSFFGNQSCYKALRTVKARMFQLCSSFSQKNLRLSKIWIEFLQACGSYCTPGFCARITRYCLCFCFQDSISWLGWGICWELSWEWGSGGLKMGGIKTLGHHSSTTKKCKLCKCNLTIYIIKPHTLMFFSNALKLLLNNYIFYNYWMIHNFLTKYS